MAELTRKQTLLTERFVEGAIDREAYDLLNAKYRDEKILLEVTNQRLENFMIDSVANKKIFAYILWTNWLLERIFEGFRVRGERIWRMKLSWIKANVIFSAKKPLTYAVNGPLDFVRND
jgi:NDP-sugar pyrophosphorylase family protein